MINTRNCSHQKILTTPNSTTRQSMCVHVDPKILIFAQFIIQKLGSPENEALTKYIMLFQHVSI